MQRRAAGEPILLDALLLVIGRVDYIPYQLSEPKFKRLMLKVGQSLNLRGQCPKLDLVLSFVASETRRSLSGFLLGNNRRGKGVSARDKWIFRLVLMQSDAWSELIARGYFDPA